MIKIESMKVDGWETAIRGMRNPMNSWDKSDSYTGCEKLNQDCNHCCNHGCNNSVNDDDVYDCRYGIDKHFIIGSNDYNLMMKLAKAGSVHAKYRRMIIVYADITAPLYWWKEYDTYKVGTVANSCSTMHKIADKEFTLNDFSHEHLTGRTSGLRVNADGKEFMCSAYDFLQITCDVLNHYRNLYLNGFKGVPGDDAQNIEPKSKDIWWQMIQLLPSSYNQKRTVMLNYEVLAGIYIYRKEHKLDEWREFCKWIESLPYSEVITCIATTKKMMNT